MCGNFFREKFSPVSVCFFLCSFLFTACGLDTLYYLEPPTSSREIIDNNDRERDVFVFTTGDNSEIGSDFIFQGTQIYYKIFGSKEAAENSYSQISSSNSSSDISEAANSIINRHKYVSLIAEGTNDIPFIKDNNVAVEIRLNSYLPEYKRGIKINGVTRYDPKRFHTEGSKKVGFEFSKTKDPDNNPVPKIGDEDVSAEASSSSDCNYWYVDVWAFSQGRDNDYSYSYSRALHLGCIKISVSEYDN
nr:hypothetical protein [uncultured Treponema sp.]